MTEITKSALNQRIQGNFSVFGAVTVLHVLIFVSWKLSAQDVLLASHFTKISV